MDDGVKCEEQGNVSLFCLWGGRVRAELQQCTEETSDGYIHNGGGGKCACEERWRNPRLLYLSHPRVEGLGRLISSWVLVWVDGEIESEG